LGVVLVLGGRAPPNPPRCGISRCGGGAGLRAWRPWALVWGGGGDTLVPAGDHLAGAEGELERFAAVPGGVELCARGERNPHVVDRDTVARGRFLAVADSDVGRFQCGGRGAFGGVDFRLFQRHGPTVPSIAHSPQGGRPVRWSIEARQMRILFTISLPVGSVGCVTPHRRESWACDEAFAH